MLLYYIGVDWRSGIDNGICLSGGWLAKGDSAGGSARFLRTTCSDAAILAVGNTWDRAFDETAGSAATGKTSC